VAGILDPKTRVMDFIMTELGREQAAQGEMRIKYATFTDRAAFYSSGSIKGVADPAENRLYFEAASSPHDSIVIESDFDGNIKPFDADEFKIDGSDVIKQTALPGQDIVLKTGQILPIASKILNSITSSIESTQYIRTTDLFIEDRDFVAEPKTLFYSYNDDPDLPSSPYSESAKSVVLVDQLTSLFQDKKLAHIPSFHFLPPRNMPSPENNDGNSLGEYAKFRDEYDDKQNPRKAYDDSLNSGFEKRRIYFNERTPDNNLIVQPFHFSEDGVDKLSVVDGGQYVKETTGERRHVFYIGRLFADTKKTTTYIHLFTLVFRERN